jgi:hypothetical protein
MLVEAPATTTSTTEPIIGATETPGPTLPGIGEMGSDRVAAAVEELAADITEPFTHGGPVGPKPVANAADGQIYVRGKTFSAEGVTAPALEPVDGYFVVTKDPSNATDTVINDFGSFVNNWLNNGETQLEPQDFVNAG